MRVYIVGMAAMVVEVGSIVLLLRQGGFALRVAVLALAISVAASWSAASQLGLAGAAAGSVLAIYLDRVFMLRRISRQTGISLRELQDWRALIWTLVSAALAAGLAWLVVREFVFSGNQIVNLIAGALVLAVSYVLMNIRRFTR